MVRPMVRPMGRARRESRVAAVEGVVARHELVARVMEREAAAAEEVDEMLVGRSATTLKRLRMARPAHAITSGGWAPAAVPEAVAACSREVAPCSYSTRKSKLEKTSRNFLPGFCGRRQYAPMARDFTSPSPYL